jgi:hypothetical protein
VCILCIFFYLEQRNLDERNRKTMGAKHSRQNMMMNNGERRESMRTVNTTNKANINQKHGSSSVSQSTNSVIIDGRQYHNVDTSTYCLPRDELEQDRLNSVSTMTKLSGVILYLTFSRKNKATFFIKGTIRRVNKYIISVYVHKYGTKPCYFLSFYDSAMYCHQ